MYVPYFFLEQLEFVTSPHDIIQQVPDFSLEEIFSKFISILYFCFQHEFVVVESKLNLVIHTLAIPLDPHSPTDSKEYLMGSRITSLL